MAKLSNSQHKLLPILIFLSLFSLHHSSAATLSIGVNYGTTTNNLLPLSQVAHFLESQTIIDRIKILDANPDILKAFTVTVENGHVPAVAELPAAKSWVANNILPFHPQTKINLIADGHEILATENDTLIDHLLPAMKALKSAFDSANVTDIHVSTPHSLGILAKSEPLSSGRFERWYDEVIFAPILDFHRKTKSPFMINSYPFFECTDKTLDYALFKPNDGVLDRVTGLTYTNMFNAQLNVVYLAMEEIGYGDVDIVVAESGWPSKGEPNQPDANKNYALSYNANLVKHVNSEQGTPLMQDLSDLHLRFV